jgi:hypothetical protein
MLYDLDNILEVYDLINDYREKEENRINSLCNICDRF